MFWISCSDFNDQVMFLTIPTEKHMTFKSARLVSGEMFSSIRAFCTHFYSAPKRLAQTKIMRAPGEPKQTLGLGNGSFHSVIEVY